MAYSEHQAAKINGPRISGVAVIATTASSAATDVTATAQLGPKCDARFVTMIADADLYYAWGASGDTVDETATSGATRCALLPANTLVSEFVGGTHIIVKGSVGFLRMWISSP